MMTHEKAADYFIVAWIKGWTIRRYFSCIMEMSDKEASTHWEEAHTLFPWLPYWIAKGACVRPFVAIQYPILNTKLWDATDHKARLVLAPLILPYIARDAWGNRRAKEKREHLKELNKDNVICTAYKAQVSLSSRKTHDWKVCK